jgi:hypothetical protein
MDRAIGRPLAEIALRRHDGRGAAERTQQRVVDLVRDRAEHDRISRAERFGHVRERHASRTRAQRQDPMTVLVSERERGRDLAGHRMQVDAEVATPLFQTRALVRSHARDERGMDTKPRSGRGRVRHGAAEAPIVLAREDVARHVADGKECRHRDVRALDRPIT